MNYIHVNYCLSLGLSEDRYPKQLFSREWEQRKACSTVVYELFVSLGLNKHEWVEDIKRGESSLASFSACIEESTSEGKGKH